MKEQKVFTKNPSRDSKTVNWIPEAKKNSPEFMHSYN